LGAGATASMAKIATSLTCIEQDLRASNGIIDQLCESQPSIRDRELDGSRGDNAPGRDRRRPLTHIKFWRHSRPYGRIFTGLPGGSLV
jgi:hypothetical protein